MKEQDQTPEEKVSEVKRDNLSEQVFRVMIIKMIKELGRRMDAHSEKLEDLTNREEKNRDETNMKNTIEGIKIRLYDTEEQISEWKKGSDNHCRWKEKEKKEYEKKREQFKRPAGQHLAHIHIIGVPEFSTSKQAL